MRIESIVLIEFGMEQLYIQRNGEFWSQNKNVNKTNINRNKSKLHKNSDASATWSSLLCTSSAPSTRYKHP